MEANTWASLVMEYVMGKAPIPMGNKLNGLETNISANSRMTNTTVKAHIPMPMETNTSENSEMEYVMGKAPIHSENNLHMQETNTSENSGMTGTTGKAHIPMPMEVFKKVYGKTVCFSMKRKPLLKMIRQIPPLNNY